MSTEDDDDQIPAMPEDFAAAPAEAQWKRIQRSTRQAARLQADVGTLRAQLAEATTARASLAPLEAQLAEATAARQAAEARAESVELRIPLIRAGIEDDEVADIVIARWRRSQAAVADPAMRKPLGDWVTTDAHGDKVAAALIPGRKVDPPKVGNPDKGTSTVVQPTGALVSEDDFRRANRAAVAAGRDAYQDPTVKAYFAQNGLQLPKPRK